MPVYTLDDFLLCCGKSPNSVILINTVLKDAQKDFHLNTKADLLEFISNGGLEDITFINTKEWENNPDKESVIYVDAYNFMTMFRLGYIAFFRNSRGSWIIKSFHLSNDRNLAMEIAFRKAGLIGIIL
jgi:hypothetical protein